MSLGLSVETGCGWWFHSFFGRKHDMLLSGSIHLFVHTKAVEENMKTSLLTWLEDVASGSHRADRCLELSQFVTHGYSCSVVNSQMFAPTFRKEFRELGVGS